VAAVVSQVRASNAQMASMVDSLQEGILVQVRSGEVIRTNASARRILGLSEADILARRWRHADWTLTLPDGTTLDADQVPSLVCLRTGVPVRGFLMRMGRPSGPPLFISVNVEPVFADDSGVPTMAVTSISDISDRREHEEALRKLLDRVNDGVLIHHQGTILFMNTRWAELVGAPDRSAAVGKRIMDRVSPENGEIIAPRLQESERGNPQPARELRFVRPDGSEVIALVYSFPTIFDGQPALLTYARDVSQERALESKLIASNRMVALGRLAANVGHEINNPLAFLIGSAEQALTLLLNGENRDDIELRLKNVLDGAARVQNIVRDLKVLSRPSAEEQSPVDTGMVLESCLRIAHGTIAPRAKVKMDLLSRRRALCNAARVSQVFLNLLVNAAEAIPEGSPEAHTITITTFDQAPNVVVTICDTGSGIPKELLSSVFEPFFTTKTDGRGTGLGLSISHSLITAQGGRIEVESEVGRGTTMTVHLPMAPEDAQKPCSAQGAQGPEELKAEGASLAGPALPSRPRRSRLLVVDDEVQLARLIRSFLADYDVKLAFNGEDARRLLETESFDLVLCDLMMPDVTGMDLYQHVQKVKPELCSRFIFMTGGAFTLPAVTFLETMAAAGNSCVEKPFRIDDLVATIARKLEQLAPPKQKGANATKVD
jgi:PAS domain S-box-containing protein